MWRFTRGLAAVGLVSACSFFPSAELRAATLAHDAANDPAYAQGWTTGTNGGYGLGGWTLATNSSLGSLAFSITSSRLNGDGDSNGDGDIDRSGKAWAIKSDALGLSTARRSFDAAQSFNRTLSLDFDPGAIAPGGEVGLSWLNPAGAVVWTLAARGAGFELRDAIGTFMLGNPLSDEGFHLRFVLGAEGVYQMSFDAIDGSSAFEVGGVLLAPPGGSSIAGVELFSDGAGIDLVHPPQNLAAFNDLTIRTGGLFEYPVGDANLDCEVGAADYALWAAQFGQTGGGLEADFDQSGSVGAADYALWAANFGKTCMPSLAGLTLAGRLAAVPEPSTALLLALGGWLAAAGRPARRRAPRGGPPSQAAGERG